MEFAEVVKKRRMVRNFAPDPVDPAAIDRMLDLARRAPSAGYTQGQSFVVVTNPEVGKEIARLCGEEYYVEAGMHPFVSAAPVLVVPCTSEAAYHRRYQEPDKVQDDGSEIEWPIPYWHMDIGCAVMTLLLAAGFAGVHDFQALRALLGIPPDVTPVGVIPIGHPAQDVPSPSLKRGRKPLASVVHRERW
ncbi:MAG: nitroreductase family protein [Thermomicrobiales bacterium]